jgi:hypothetical protein
MKHYTCDAYCDFCPASKALGKNMWPSNFLPTAEWETKLLSPQEWRAANPNKHWIFQCFTVLSQMNVTPDELHIYHLGVNQYMLGSLLWLLVYKILPGTSSDNVNRVWDRIVSFYKEQKTSCQFSNLGLSSLHDPRASRKHYPKLKGKGSEIKGFYSRCSMCGVNCRGQVQRRTSGRNSY